MPSHSMFSIKAAGQSHISALEHHFPSFSHKSCKKLDDIHHFWKAISKSHRWLLTVNCSVVGKSMYPKKISIVNIPIIDDIFSNIHEFKEYVYFYLSITLW